MPTPDEPEHTIWVCFACGKRSRDKYGDQKIDRGWDVSCMTNAVLCHEQQVDGKWVPVEQENG